jgi:hypothetical protein
VLCADELAQPASIVIDGEFEDWAAARSYFDPPNDTHDTDHNQRTDEPTRIEHPDADLLEYKVAHDQQSLYFYFRTRGRIGHTQKGDSERDPGRYYVIVAIDVDENDDTGYWIHEGGYYPTTRGYDVNAEIEYFDGQLNTACCLNHGARNSDELAQAFLDQSQGRYQRDNDGPYPAGFMRLLPGTYEQYTQWVYHDDDSLTFVRDKGPVVKGIASAAVSQDGHQLESQFPFRGFLKDETGAAIIAPGSTLDLSFSLEASGEYALGRKWASDTGDPIEGYEVRP